MEERRLSLKESSDVLGVSERTLYRWIKSGKLKAYKPGRDYQIPEGAIRELLAESEVYPKDLSPRLPLEERGERTPEEFEQALARVLEPVREETLREQQAANRAIASEGQPQTRIVDPPEAEVGKRFLDKFSPDERPLAFSELALGYARYERENTNLQEALRRGRELLRERDQKIARLEEENAHLKEGREQAKVEKP
jgi:excisionase family DNA binding protein